MIRVRATVVSAQGDRAQLLLESERCDHCARSQACSVLGLGASGCPVVHAVGAKPGERVQVVLESGALRRGAMIAYALPVGFMLLGAAWPALFAMTARASDIAAMAGSAIGLGLGWVLARWAATQWNFQPAVTSIEQDFIIG